MAITIRFPSLFLRKRHSAKECERVLGQFREWKIPQQSLPEPRTVTDTLLIIRLDDIGDYVLFRNQLVAYRNSPRWKNHRITLLGNSSWKDLFALLDHDTVHDVIWVNKGDYLESAAYRLQIWDLLRAKGFETVIAPSRTRPLLLDDLCMLAAAPRSNLGSANTYVHASWNALSDGLYQQLFRPGSEFIHEFEFNAQFAGWVCGAEFVAPRLEIDYPFVAPSSQPYIICFIGANTRSKRWPRKRWIAFIRAYQRKHSGTILVAGASKSEQLAAHAIQARTGAESIAGKASLADMAAWIACAQAVITNDTMAAHVGAACGRPTVIIANGVNYSRFTEYARLGMNRVATLYPEFFNRRRARRGEHAYHYADAVSADIASIQAIRVLTELERVMASEAPLDDAMSAVGEAAPGADRDSLNVASDGLRAN